MHSPSDVLHYLSRATAIPLALCAALLATPLIRPMAAVADDTPALPPLIAIDPGHGGRYSNANANGLREKNVNLAVALSLRDALVARGYRVVLTRTTDRAVTLADIPTWNYNSRAGTWSYARDHQTGYTSSIPKDDLQARADIANRLGADLFISVHANGSYSRRSRGYETWASKRDALGMALKWPVQRSVILRTRLRDRGAHSADFYVLRWSNMPSILIESAFITNPYDAYLLKHSWFRRKIAAGVAGSVDAWMKSHPCKPKYPRVAGTSLSDFAAAVASTGTASPGDTAVVVRDDQCAELPGVAALAAAVDAPLLVTSASGPDTATAETLGSLAPQRVILVGTQGAFDASCTAAIATASGVATAAIESVGAPDSVSLASVVASQTGIGASGRVFIVDATDTTSTLSAASVAATTKSPLLLAEDGTLPETARAFLDAHRAQVTRIALVGSTSRLPSEIATGFAYLRYSARTADQLSCSLNAAFVHTATHPVVADTRYPREFFVSAVRAARLGQPLLPVDGNVLPVYTRLWITRQRPLIAGFEIHDPAGDVPMLMDAMLRKARYY